MKDECGTNKLKFNYCEIILILDLKVKDFFNIFQQVWPPTPSKLSVNVIPSPTAGNYNINK